MKIYCTLTLKPNTSGFINVCIGGYLYLFKRKEFYYVEYYDLDRNCSRRLSTQSSNKADALKFVSELKQRLNAKPNVEYATLNKFRYEYQDYIEKTRTPKYLTSVKLSFRMLYNAIGDAPLSSIKLRDFEKFFVASHQKAAYAALLYHRTLKAAFNKAIEWGYLHENLICKIKLPKTPKSLPFFLIKADLDKIIANTKNPSLRDIFVFGFHTGMRQSEILNLKWESVNFKDNVIIVQNHESFTTKSKRERVIPINKSVRELLLKFKVTGPGKYVFVNSNGYKFSNDYISHQFKKAVRAAGLNDHIHFHDLRHGFASSLVQQGVSLYVVKDLLGHENQETTQIYAHLQNDNLFAAVNKLD